MSAHDANGTLGLVRLEKLAQGVVDGVVVQPLGQRFADGGPARGGFGAMGVGVDAEIRRGGVAALLIAGHQLVHAVQGASVGVVWQPRQGREDQRAPFSGQVFLFGPFEPAADEDTIGQIAAVELADPGQIHPLHRPRAQVLVVLDALPEFGRVFDLHHPS